MGCCRRQQFTPAPPLPCPPSNPLHPPCSMLFVDYAEFCTRTEHVVRQVAQFVGADPALVRLHVLPPSLVSERRGRRMHPSVRAKLLRHFEPSNQRLYALLGRDFRWGQGLAASASSTPGYGAVQLSVTMPPSALLPPAPAPGSADGSPQRKQQPPGKQAGSAGSGSSAASSAAADGLAPVADAV